MDNKLPAETVKIKSLENLYAYSSNQQVATHCDCYNIGIMFLGTNLNILIRFLHI